MHSYCLTCLEQIYWCHLCHTFLCHHWWYDSKHQSLQSTYILLMWRFFVDCTHPINFMWSFLNFISLAKLILFFFCTILVSSVIVKRIRLSSALSNAFSAFSDSSTSLSCFLHSETLCLYPPQWKIFHQMVFSFLYCFSSYLRHTNK